IGDMVLLYKSGIHKRKKLEERWRGPYYIHEVLSNGTYKLRTPNDKILKAQEDPDSYEIYCLKNYKYRHPNRKIKKISSLQIMEYYSKELRANFCQFLKTWLQEANSDEKLEISTSA
ncbi:19744_t:CDS:2, partial [Funneliformis geosporum]